MLESTKPASSVPATFKALLAVESDRGVDREIVEVSENDLSEGEILVKVQYSSVNYKDALSVQPNAGVAVVARLIPGIDLVGTVVRGTDAFPAGSTVLAHTYGLGASHDGGFAEYARIPEEWALPLPEGISARESMILGTAGFTAAHCLHVLEAHGLTAGAGPVLVTGASGGLGSLTVDLFASQGYEVVASTGKPEAAQFLTDLGAAQIIDREELSRDSGKLLDKGRWASAVDVVGGLTLATVIKSTRYGGAVAVTGLTGGKEFPLSVMPFILRAVTVIGVDSAHLGMDLRRHLWQRLGSDWRPRGLDHPLMVKEITLDELNNALDDIYAGRLRGRVILRLED